MKFRFGMTCEEYSMAKTGRHDHRLTLSRILRMALHWLICVYCRRLGRQWSQIRRLLAHAPPEKKMPDTLRKKLRERTGGID